MRKLILNVLLTAHCPTTAVAAAAAAAATATSLDSHTVFRNSLMFVLSARSGSRPALNSPPSSYWTASFMQANHRPIVVLPTQDRQTRHRPGGTAKRTVQQGQSLADRGESTDILPGTIESLADRAPIPIVTRLNLCNQVVRVAKVCIV